MSKDELTPQTSAGAEGSEFHAVDHKRRKLTTAGIGAGAVLATLASRPVFANACSVSGMQSGNASPQPGQLPCGGCTPGFWAANAVNWNANKWPSPYLPTTTFNSIFGETLYKHCDGTPLTLLEVLRMKGNEDPYCPNLGKHTVAALLNAASFQLANSDYGYNDGDIITMFNNRGACVEFKDMLDMLNNRGCPWDQPTKLQDDASIKCKSC